MRPVDKMFGPVGAIDVSFDEHGATVLCRNGLDDSHSIFTTTLEIGSKLQSWIQSNKLGMLENLVPELPLDQREMCLSGIDPEKWDEYFKEEQDE